MEPITRYVLSDSSSDVAGAVAAAKAAAAAVMAAQHEVAAAKHAALEHQSAASVKGVAAAQAAHKRYPTYESTTLILWRPTTARP